MSKFLKVSDGGYTIQTETGSEIKLDTGDQVGRVLVTGNLEVLGTSITIDSEDLAIKDNLIILNDGETGAGVTLNVSGIQIDRGTLDDALFLFDENLQWVDPQDATTQSGAFVLRDASGKLSGLKLASIFTNSETDFNFYLPDPEGGWPLGSTESDKPTLRIVGAADYENRVLDADDIPNKAYVDTKIDTEISQQLGAPSAIIQGDTQVAVSDFDETATPSDIRLVIDGNALVTLNETELTVFDLIHTDTSITTSTLDDNINLNTSGTGTVKINKALEIEKDLDPVNDPVEGVKIYSKEEGPGGTGIYYKNESSTNDELISRNRALLYSMVI
jgi:hypothetical protein